MATTEKENYPELSSNPSQPEVIFNQLAREIEAKKGGVVSRTRDAQPSGASVTAGDTYIMTAAASGTDWTTYAEDSIAHYYNGAWYEYPPNEGWRVWVNDEDSLVAYDGSLWGSLGMNTINASTTITVGSSTTHDHASIASALTSLDSDFIQSGAIVKIELQDEIFTVLNDIEVDHVNSDRLQIVGKTVYSDNISSVTVTGASSAYTCTLHVASTNNVSAGNYALIAACSGGTNPEDLCGCWEVVSVLSSTTVDITCTSRYGTGPSGSITGEITFVPSIIHVATTTAKGISVDGYDLMLVDKLVMKGSKSDADGTHYGLNVVGQGGQITTGDNFGVNNFQRGAFIEGNAFLETPNSKYSNCYRGFLASLAIVNAPGIIISGCAAHGAYVLGGSKFQSFQGNQFFSGNVTAVRCDNNSTVALTSPAIAGNNTGCEANQHGYLRVAAATVTRNTTDYSPAANTVGNEEAYVDT